MPKTKFALKDASGVSFFSKISLPFLFFILSLGALAVIKVRDPHIPGSFPVCPSLALTGFACQGCGSMRAMRDISDGKFVEALDHNILVPFALIWLVWWFVSFTGSRFNIVIKRPPSGSKFIWGILIVMIVFVVLRNIPGSFLAP